MKYQKKVSVHCLSNLAYIQNNIKLENKYEHQTALDSKI